MAVHEVDARGLACPMPLLKAKLALNELAPGEQVRVRATDPGSVRDFRAFCEHSRHALVHSEETAGVYTHVIRKG